MKFNEVMSNLDRGYVTKRSWNGCECLVFKYNILTKLTYTIHNQTISEKPYELTLQDMKADDWEMIKGNYTEETVFNSNIMKDTRKTYEEGYIESFKRAHYAA